MDGGTSGSLGGLLGGLGTLFAMLAFIGIVVWAWSRRRKRDFEAAARMPLEEDARPAGRDDQAGPGGRRQ